MEKALIISPHIDDAYFSLGGTIAKKEYSSITVVNIFSKHSYSLNKIARTFNDVKKITEKRKKEELSNSVRFNVHTEFWDYPDVILRGYDKWFSNYDDRDTHLIDELSKKIYQTIRKRFCSVFFPLGIGKNCDHRLVSKIGIDLIEKLEDSYTKIMFYEDMPYAAYFPSMISRTSQKYYLKPEMIDISKQIKIKIECCKMYSSQIKPLDLFLIKLYAKTINPNAILSNRYYERVWFRT